LRVETCPSTLLAKEDLMPFTSTFDLTATRDEGYRFTIRFEGTDLAPLVTDEPPPLGKNEGPNPSRLLAAALVNCLAASLVFALSKKAVTVNGLTASAHVSVGRNEKNRLRIERVEVLVSP
jgi:uncharacterized OsmC-like protein